MNKLFSLFIAFLIPATSYSALVEISMRDGSVSRGDLLKLQNGKSNKVLFNVVGGKMSYDADKILKTFRRIERIGQGEYLLVFKTGKKLQAKIAPRDIKIILEVGGVPQSVYLKHVYSIEISDLHAGKYITVNSTELKDNPNGKALGILKKGAQFERIDQKGKWTKIKITGWVWTPATQE